ncbi:H-2 class II histocompatibility antigen, A-Q alpha chain-like [Hoplias malabaricus]|uniref:H-2 class II histocompatibility antigen, A-Q alpha chain-like n=1 Tax=Hoplias malabaricus TaxID=27720 RepID=UPI0034634D54
MIRMKLCLILICTAWLHTEAKSRHRVIGVTLCSDTDGEVMYGSNGDEMYHVDFSTGKGVFTLPPFSDPLSYPRAYERSVVGMDICKDRLKSYTGGHSKPEPRDAPQSSIYSEDDAELDSKNTLICHITGFYPPHVEVTWTRNNVNVTDGVSLSRYYPNDDGTFSLFSHLSLIPKLGDVYSCSVEHTALDRPLPRTWEVDVELPGVGASVFCGVGLAGGLLGVAVGTFFLIKGNNCN